MRQVSAQPEKQTLAFAHKRELSEKYDFLRCPEIEIHPR